MNTKRGIGFLLIFIGIALLFNSASGITGFVISEIFKGNFSFILGLAVLIVGMLVMEEGRGDYSSAKDYYPKRVEEIFDKKYNQQDVWIHRGEISGILNELQSNTKYKKVHLEHGRKSPTIHLSGGPGVPKFLEHLDIKTKDISRHLFISDDPYDSRIENVGISSAGSSKDQERGNRVKSRIYNPNYPRSKDIQKTVVETMSPSERKKAA